MPDNVLAETRMVHVRLPRIFDGLGQITTLVSALFLILHLREDVTAQRYSDTESDLKNPSDVS